MRAACQWILIDILFFIGLLALIWFCFYSLPVPGFFSMDLHCKALIHQASVALYVCLVLYHRYVAEFVIKKLVTEQ